MKEFKLIIPSEHYTQSLTSQVEYKLLTAYKGFTKTYGYGGYNSEELPIVDEHVVIYRVAGEKDWPLLNDIALFVKRSLGEKEIYAVGNKGPTFI